LEFIWNKATNPVPPASFAVDSMEIWLSQQSNWKVCIVKILIKITDLIILCWWHGIWGASWDDVHIPQQSSWKFHVSSNSICQIFAFHFSANSRTWGKSHLKRESGIKSVKNKLSQPFF
jgi:hypothetical protein